MFPRYKMFERMITFVAGIAVATAVAGTPESAKSPLPYELVPLNQCGLVCLQTCSRLVGGPMQFETVRGAVDTPSDEMSLLQLQEAAEEVGLSSVAVRWNEAIPEEITPPAILPIVFPSGRRHFVTLVRTENDQAFVIDFPHDPAWIQTSRLRERYGWNGTALYIARRDADLNAVRAETGWRWRYALAGVSAAALVLALPALRRLRRRSMQRTKEAMNET